MVTERLGGASSIIDPSELSANERGDGFGPSPLSVCSVGGQGLGDPGELLDRRRGGDGL